VGLRLVEAPVTAGPWDPRAAQRTGRDRLRASDADREQVIDVLKAAFAAGRLAKDEFCLRTGQALASRTYGDLAAATVGIPARRSEPPPSGTTGAPARSRVEPRTVVWAAFLLLMPATLGTAFLTHLVWFFVMFLVAFVGVTVTAQPAG
jgi:DUF1707 SHOCT-like domain